MDLSPKPVEIAYRRYKSKRRGYIVQVINVAHHQGKHGYYTTITVRDKTGKEGTWPASTFLRDFEPVGRKIQPNRYARLRRKKDLV